MTELRDYQSDAIEAISAAYGRGVRSQLLAMATGAGKCLGKGTPVLMFDGTIKPVEEITAGHLLMGPDSRPRRVLSTTKGFGPLYRVTPVKGDSYVVNDAHILSMVISGDKSVAGFKAGSVVNMPVTEYLAQSGHFKHCAKGWRTAVDWPEREVSIDPYWLGLWLGDGSSRCTTIYKPDAEVAEYVQSYAARLGLRYACVEAGSKCPGHSISSQGGPNQNPLKDSLRSYDLLLNKHIPLEYIANSRPVRVALMAGLIDSDGHAEHGGIDFVFSSERLASDVAKLARSLGLAAYLKPCRKTCTNNGKTGDYFRISVSGDLSEYPVRIGRKKSAPRQQRKDVLRTGIKVTPESEGDYYGFEIDGDRLFLLGDFTVTHNTVVFASLVSRRHGRALVLAHRDRLIQQAAAKLGAVLPLHEIGIVMGEQNRLHARCVVASVQTLARRRRLAVMPKFDLVIVDECHRSAAASYQRILAHVRHEETLLLGVTATPSRTDGVGLDQVYDETVYQIGIVDLIRRGHLVPLRGQRLAIEADFSKLRTQKTADGVKDYREDELCGVMEAANWFEKASEGWMKYAPDRRTLAFTPRVAMAHRLARHMRDQGVRAVALDGLTPQDVQRRALADFERGEIQFISSCDLLTEGVDLPSANCILLARPTQSQIVYSQTIGRGTRLSPETGKVDCLVLDLVGATEDFDLVTLADLVGVKKLKDGETIVEAVEREKREAEEAAAEQMTLPEIATGEVVGREVDLLAAKEVQKRGVFEWHAYPARKQAVLKVAGHEFRIVRVGDVYSFADMGWGSRFQGQSYDYREARDRCEEEARRVLFGKNGGWRAEPATPNQVALMSRMRIPIPPHCTKGQASYLIETKQRKARATA
jgi:superfamily II DNA or RNA helicase